MELALAVLGIFGTLGGTFLGSWLQSKQQREQRAFEDQARFHATRLETYAAFLGILRRFTVFVYRSREQLDSEATTDQRKSIDELQSELWVTVERLALLSSGDVVRLAEQMYSDVNLYVVELRAHSTQKERLDASLAFMKTFFRTRDELRTAMRQDLSVASQK